MLSDPQLGLTYAQFTASAPNLTCEIANPAIAGSSLLKVDLQQKKMSTGSFGWSGSGQKMNVEIRLSDGSLRTVQAQVRRYLVEVAPSLISCVQVSINLTIVGSKKADEFATEAVDAKDTEQEAADSPQE